MQEDVDQEIEEVEIIPESEKKTQSNRSTELDFMQWVKKDLKSEQKNTVIWNQ